jgi:cyclophilin family peptidyl-prolyl cis-trans isomerase
MVQTGDPTGTGNGGESIYGMLYGAQARFFDDEITPKLKHTKVSRVLVLVFICYHTTCSTMLCFMLLRVI